MPINIKKILLSTPAKILAGLLIAYLLFSYFAVNPIAKKLVPWVGREFLASQASIRQFTFDPWRLKTTIEGLKLANFSGQQLTSVEKMVVDVELSGIFNWAWKFKEISLVQPKVHLNIQTDGRLNWADLIAKLNEDPSPPSDSIPRVLIQRFAIQQGHINYSDAHTPTPIQTEITPLNFTLDGFSTLPKDRGQYLFAAHLPDHGGTLKWNGSLSVNPMQSKGNVAFEHIQVPKVLQLIKGLKLPVTVQHGNVDAQFSYDFSMLQQSEAVAKNTKKDTKKPVPASQPAPQLIVKKLVLKLNEMQLNVLEKSHLSLKTAEILLPALTLQLQKNIACYFDDSSVQLHELMLSSTQNQTLLKLPHLAVSKIAFDLAQKKLNVGNIALNNGEINLNRNAEGQLNWQEAFTPVVAVDDTANKLTEAAQTATLAPAKNAVNSKNQLNSANSEQPFTIELPAIGFNHWKLAFNDDTFENPLKANVADINIALDVLLRGDSQLVQSINATIQDISVASSTAKQPDLKVNQLLLNNGRVDLAKQQVTLEAVVLSGLNTALIKADKTTNWQTMLAQKPAKNNQAAKLQGATQPSQKAPWDVNLNKIALENANVHIEDRTLTKPFMLDIQQSGFELQHASLDLKKALPAKLHIKVKQGGALNVLGKITPQPFKTALNVKLSQFSLIPFSAFINQYALLNLNDGSANLSGQLNIRQDKALTVEFKGGFSVNQLAIVEEQTNAPFLAWDKVATNDLAFGLSPNQLNIANLDIIKPIGKMIIYPDKTMNVTRMLRSSAASHEHVEFETAPENQPEKNINLKPDAKPAPLPNNTNQLTYNALNRAENNPRTESHSASVALSAPQNSEPFPIKIERINIQSAQLEFADLSLTPQFGTYINSLSGVINGVSTQENATAQVELDGKVDAYGLARVRGALQPFNITQFTDIQLAFKNLEMNKLTPYSGKFAGRRIDSGKLSVDLQYKIKQRQLAGENKFILNKLVLGEKVESSDAADLPLDLAIAILEDSDGVIDLDLPISGSLDDPKFSYGSIVWKAIRNVLTKIVTSPFRALGKLFGGSGEALESIAFDAGNAHLLPPEQEKLKKLSSALEKRQGLGLIIVPTFATDKDTRALQEQSIKQKILEEAGIQLVADQQAGPIDLNNTKNQKAIDALYDTLTKKPLIKKLAAKFEKPKAGHYEEALEKLTQSIEVSEEKLQILAKARAEVISKTLSEAGVSPTRIKINPTQKADVKDAFIHTPLSLEVNKK